MKPICRLGFISLLIVFVLAGIPGLTAAQDSGSTGASTDIICASEVIVQADDWLSKIAEKFLGDALAFPIIINATNLISQTDSSYARILNPDVIEPGQKLCIPEIEVAEQLLIDASLEITSTEIREDVDLDVPTPQLVEYNQLQFIWEWDGLDTVSNEDWYFDIKIYSSPNAPYPYNVLVANPDATQYFDGKWYSDLTTSFSGCSYWAVQIAKRDASGEFAGHISQESERMKVGLCESSTFSSPLN